MKKVFSLLAMIAILGISTPAFAAPGGPHGHGKGPGMHGGPHMGGGHRIHAGVRHHRPPMIHHGHGHGHHHGGIMLHSGYPRHRCWSSYGYPYGSGYWYNYGLGYYNPCPPPPPHLGGFGISLMF